VANERFGCCLPAAEVAALVTGTSTIDVVAGVITDVRGRILLARRTEGRDLAGLWEFPAASANRARRQKPH
jgi:8-oxo-dGTP pyrophosphatase MutT (NUDIX family)